MQVAKRTKNKACKKEPRKVENQSTYLALPSLLLLGVPAVHPAPHPAQLALPVRVPFAGQCVPLTGTAPCSEELEMQFALMRSGRGNFLQTVVQHGQGGSKAQRG
eukprot:1139265-Pelagomonas_calceolata.AAC.3